MCAFFFQDFDRLVFGRCADDFECPGMAMSSRTKEAREPRALKEPRRWRLPRGSTAPSLTSSKLSVSASVTFSSSGDFSVLFWPMAFLGRSRSRRGSANGSPVTAECNRSVHRSLTFFSLTFSMEFLPCWAGSRRELVDDSSGAVRRKRSLQRPLVLERGTLRRGFEFSAERSW